MQSADSTVLHIVQRWAREHPNDPAVTFVPREGKPRNLTFADLWQRTSAVAELLKAKTSPGSAVLLLYPSSLEFVEAFLGCLLARRIAVPAAVPRNEKAIDRAIAIARDCETGAVITTAALLPKLETMLGNIPSWRPPVLLATDDRQQGRSKLDHIDVLPDDVAFLQYTSGSTSHPKGVVVSHANLSDNLSHIRRDFGFRRSTRLVNWLPAYHDMGLIGGILAPLHAGARTVLMSPTQFVLRPATWLQLITEYGGTISGAPNFAYEACVSRVSDKQMSGLDLSSWRVAFNGSEPVRGATLERFAAKFAPCGFDQRALFPCYGLAESTLLVACKGARTDSPAVKLDRDALNKGRAVEIAGSQQGRSLVSCGGLIQDHTIAIVNPETRQRCSDTEIGEIWLSGPSIAQGYWNRDKETQEGFRARLEDEPEKGFLRTGDLGFVRDDELYIAGRIKNIVIIRGLNYSCEDIEEIAQASHPAVQSSAGAAISVEDADGERLVVLQEVSRPHVRHVDCAEAVASIQESIVMYYGVSASDVVLVMPGSLPRTTSGKIQRHKARERYLNGRLSLLPMANDGHQNVTRPLAS